MERPVVISIAAVAVIAVGVVLYFVFFSGSAAPPEEDVAPAPVETVPAEVEPEPEPPPVELPALDASDEIVRLLVQEISSHPELAAAFATDELIRKFVATVENIAAGNSPVPHLSYLEPERDFRIVRRGGRLYPDPANFARYDWIADVVASLDTQGTVQLYHQLKPLLDEAYRDLGYPEGDFTETLNAAIDRLLDVPVSEERQELKLRVLTYDYADEELQALGPAEKHLLRMGPANALKVQGKLRELRVALTVSQ